MNNARLINVLPLALVVFAPLLSGADLSTYRGFQLGMTLTSAVKHSGMDPSEVTITQQHPAQIEELAWIPERFSDSAGQMDPVKQVLFTFYNGQLFRIVVDYDAEKTEGMSIQDMIDGTSVRYGAATRPAAQTLLPSDTFSEGVAVVARWDDADCSWALVRSPYGTGFGLIGLSKRLDRLAEAAITSGKHLVEQEAPQREKADQQILENKLAKVRLTNRTNFRP